MVRGIDTAAAVLPLKPRDTNLPDAGRLITALRQIGYNLEQAIADLIDNSINAGAKNVLVRFMHDGERIVALAVVDDGAGMSDAELEDAMRFGSREKGDPTTLGKFGMGMKLASLSHARSVTVFSRTDGRSSARRWTLDGITSGWWCERIQTSTAADMLDSGWGPMDLGRNGTVVLWEDVDRLPSHRSGLKYTLTSLERRLRLHLGMCFHRFIESGRLKVLLDQLLVQRQGQGLQSEISALNPFGYQESGSADYPKRLSLMLTGIGKLSLDAHVWPANSELDEYKLGRRASSRQGMYFYRNDRLIQAGGWNGLLHDETEPHSSLARVCIDLPIEYDDWFGINVQKSSVLVPPVFGEVLGATAADGSSFEYFRRSAIESYRRSNHASAAVAPLPTHGLPALALRELRSLYGKGKHAETQGFSVVWHRLPRNEFFRLDRSGARLLVNARYRPTNPEDAQTANLIKLLLAIVFRRDFMNNGTKSREREIAAVNELMVATVSDT